MEAIQVCSWWYSLGEALSSSGHPLVDLDASKKSCSFSNWRLSNKAISIGAFSENPL